MTKTKPPDFDSLTLANLNQQFCSDWLKGQIRVLLTKNAEQEALIAEMRNALELVAAPKRSDGTYDRSREACEILARDIIARSPTPRSVWLNAQEALIAKLRDELWKTHEVREVIKQCIKYPEWNPRLTFQVNPCKRWLKEELPYLMPNQALELHKADQAVIEAAEGFMVHGVDKNGTHGAILKDALSKREELRK